jgi:hypothetical protein
MAKGVYESPVPVAQPHRGPTGGVSQRCRLAWPAARPFGAGSSPHRPVADARRSHVPPTGTSGVPEKDQVRFARGMLHIANDQHETPVNRSEALAALRGVARHIPDDVRDDVFGQVLPFAEGRRESDEAGTFLSEASDPLDRIRVSLGDASWVAPAGLMAAAALARSSGQYATVQRIAVLQLRDATEQTANSIAAALASLPADKLSLPVDLLVSHPSPWLRALAAVIWTQRSGEPEELGIRLAQDTSYHVRMTLARHLSHEDHHFNLRAILTKDPRRSVRLLAQEQPQREAT